MFYEYLQSTIVEIVCVITAVWYVVFANIIHTIIVYKVNLIILLSTNISYK